MESTILRRVQPIAPVRTKELFDDPDWLFDFKYDGFWAPCYLEQGRCRSISRKGNVMSRFIGLGEKIAASLHADDAILDGEVIARLTDSYNPCARRLKIKNPGYSQNEGRRELFDKAPRRRYRLDKLIAARRRCPGV